MDAFSQRHVLRTARLWVEPRYFVGMDEQTRLHMSSAIETDLGHIDALYELDLDEAREILRDSLARQHDFRFLDTVLADFLRTNKHEGNHWSLEELLRIDSSHPGVEFDYLNRNILWTSTVWRRQCLLKQTKCIFVSFSHFFWQRFNLHSLLAGSHGKQICLKLHNDGFRYLSRPGPQRGRHNTSTSEQPGEYMFPGRLHYRAFVSF